MDPDIAAVGHDHCGYGASYSQRNWRGARSATCALRLFLEDAVGVVDDLGEAALQAIEATGEGVEALARGTGGGGRQRQRQQQGNGEVAGDHGVVPGLGFGASMARGR